VTARKYSGYIFTQQRIHVEDVLRILDDWYRESQQAITEVADQVPTVTIRFRTKMRPNTFVSPPST
jgi:hypothetical protein